ncbi:MAG: autotransporter domain-containing protein [Haliea sp.]|nr:autotransporter domain-containing protein [Haliea sp.]
MNAAFGLNVGGSGGAGGDGNSVTVTNQAALATSGVSAKGIFAQSVGGGGGDGGTASSDSISFNGVCKLVTGGNQYLCSTADAPDDVTQVSASLTIEVGGKGGAAGDGEAVNVSNSATITTTGRLAHAIKAHSVGGGGGEGGEGQLGIAGWTTSKLAQALDSLGELWTSISDFTNVGIGVGGSGGAAGTGGVVTVNNTSTLTTSGDHAFGIHAQSVGGGGGNGGAGSTGLTPNITVGGAGSGGGDGGDVTVVGFGPISTTGRGGIGIFAQSVGGGGGTAGDVEMGLTTEHLNIGVGVGVQRSAGAGGNGGTVNVTSGPLTTTGYAAHGVFAHSVGGSGGVAGISGVFEGGPTSFVGSAGDQGDAGAVSIDVDGVISVSGEDAHAVFAQSASGKTAGDTSGDVTINVYQNTSATGLDGRGILAQSASVDNAQNGAIKIYVGPYQGTTDIPTVTTGASSKETLYLWGGANNTITNAGTLTQQNASSYVIRTDAVATTTVDNTGTINGSILGATVASDPLRSAGGVNQFVFAGPSSIDVHNRQGGNLNAGLLLDVRNLDNQGTLAVGGSNQIGTTRLTGDLRQSGDGRLMIDLDPRQPLDSEQGDRLIIDGSANLGGKVTVNLLDTWQAVPGEQSLAILTAGGGLTLGEQPLTQSAVAQYQLQQPISGELRLTYDIDFANAGITAQTNDNQDDVARYIHGIYLAGALDDAVARELIAIEDTADYAQVMNSLGAEIAVDTQTTSLLSGLRFNDALLSCAQRSGDYHYYDLGQCGWLRASGQSFSQQETDDNLGFDENTWQFAGGGQIDLRNDWHLGGALSYERSNLDADDSNARSDGDRFQIGVSAKRRFHATELSGSLATSYGSFDINRSPAPGVSLDSNQDLWLYSGQLRAAQLFEHQRWSIKPRIDLGVDYLSTDGFNEGGNSDVRLLVDGYDNTYVHVQPAVDVATEFDTEDGMLIRPRFTLGITQFLGGAAPEVTGRFAGAPNSVTPFTASTDLDKTRVEIAAGVDVFAVNNVVVRAEVFGSVSDNSDSYGGGVKVALPF